MSREERSFAVTTSRSLALLESLASEINRTGEPAAVLLAAAKRERLAPEQLHKLASDFNVLRVRQHLRRSAKSGRGQAVPVVDAAALASELALGSDEIRPQTGGRRKSASAFDHDPFRVMPAIQKQAAAPPPPEERRRSPSLADDIAAEHRKLASAQDARTAAKFRAVEKVEAFVKAAAAPGVLAKLAEDCKLLAPETATLFSVTWPVLEQAGAKPWDGRPTCGLARDRTSHLELAKSAATALAAFSSADDELTKVAAGMTSSPLPFPNQKPKAGGKPAGGQDPASYFEQRLDPSRAFADIARGLLDEKPDVNPQVVQFATDPGRAAQFAAVQYDPAGGISAEIQAAQMKWDEGVRERRRLANLQRILVSDPIVSKSDPVIGMEIYQNLAALDPNIAEKPMLLAQLMRTAIQQQTLDPMDLRGLLEIEKLNLETNEKLRREQPQAAKPGVPKADEKPKGGRR